MLELISWLVRQLEEALFWLHNKEKDAENRSVPKALDTELQARQAFHEQLGSDMSNTTLDWSVCMIFTDIGSIIASERWEVPKPEIVI